MPHKKEEEKIQKIMKQLSEMTNEKLWKLFSFIIQPYNPEWPKL